MFQILSQTNTVIIAMANQGAMGYAQLGGANGPPPHGARDLPYGIPYGWRTEAPTAEEHKQQNVVNNEGAKVVLNAGSEAALSLGDDSRIRQVQRELLPQSPPGDYYRKMVAYVYDDKILVHCFQDSLTRAALSWCVSLERGRIKTWRYLVEAFLNQYKYNKDMALDRSRLQNMLKKEQEGFKEYAQRWCELAAQVQPLIIEREMVTMFIDTLLVSYYDKVVRNVASNFADLVVGAKG
ncbi:hypothetical protein CR513_12468, partial [Mucuna pruriens]